MKTSVLSFLRRYGSLFLYGVALASLLFLLKWLELRFLFIHYSIELYIGSIALVFTLLGIWLSHKLTRPKVVVLEREVLVPGPGAGVNNEMIARLGISKREMEVLTLIAEGLSNEEIAARLFVSLNTVKTHSSRVFGKMEVRRRTQAIDKARRMGLIP
ncbi:response regulator transcription factor [Hufsiella ginkgonis]|uniref:DNA-binding response regulator n=1 Tax=Hufsiella ginkgonis TaxID=2695274 RepID=A0A7K1XYQ3_9SPHI|nr:response regulator transcription factor [Hufsiella ginkgonis]MXV16100.1 DNA-binding response regulator [Hufsiella ginkgonis]